MALGDGFAALGKADQTVSIWNFATGTTTDLGKGTNVLDVSIAGDRVAYRQGPHKVVVQSLPGTGATRPLLLGVLTTGHATAASPWTAAVDVTKPVAAGTVVIRATDGTVVRTLATEASDTGSLRGITWDGRDDQGNQRQGRYTWELVASATDGSGAVASINADQVPQGTITVG